MRRPSPESDHYKPSRREIRDQRIDELLDICRDQVLQQIIGPFGLTPAMFNDKDGGEVTTQLNAEKDIYANSHEQYDQGEYKGSRYKRVRSNRLAEESLDGITKDAYSGSPIQNPDFDHTISTKEIHKKGGWRHDKEKRAEIGADSRNLNFTSLNANRSKNDRDMQEWMSESNKEKYGLDNRRVKPLIKKAEAAINDHMPDLMERVQYDVEALAKTGTQTAVKNALKQATGMVLHELVSGTHIEIKRITKEQSLQEEFVDHLIQAIKNVAQRIEAKLEKIFEAIVSGGIQGFVSNLLTYIINSIWTTAAKIVTIIREGMKELWKAIKLMWNPPKGMSGIEVAKEVTKIIAAVITSSLGLIFEETVEKFILSIPLLAPLANTIAPALTAILTGIVTALVVFGIDRLFDWLNDNGTEMLEAQITNLEASAALFDRMAAMLNSQFQNSEHYQQCIQQYASIETSLAKSAASLDWAIFHTEASMSSLTATIKHCEEQFPEFKRMDQELEEMINNFKFKNLGEENV